MEATKQSKTKLTEKQQQTVQVLIYLIKNKMEAKKLFAVRPTNEEQNDFIVTVGKHLATEKHFKSREEAEKYIETPKWDMVLAMVAEMFTIYDKQKKTTNEISNDAKKVVDAIIENTKKQQK